MSWFNKKPKILIVEDEADIAEGLKARLLLENFDIILSADGKEGVEKARAERPDLILLDIMIPIIDGFEVCRILKKDEKTKAIPIIVLTALPHMDDAEKAFSSGANDFLNKPYTNERLLQKVYKLLPK
jgi:DNA-binding response OmpR family regulator